MNEWGEWADGCGRDKEPASETVLIMHHRTNLSVLVIYTNARAERCGVCMYVWV